MGLLLAYPRLAHLRGFVSHTLLFNWWNMTANRKSPEHHRSGDFLLASIRASG